MVAPPDQTDGLRRANARLAWIAAGLNQRGRFEQNPQSSAMQPRRPPQVVAMAAFDGTGPTSAMISRWQDQTRRMASGVPMPAARGSPAGPNQWFCGAPVVRARRPAYVVPFTVLARTCTASQT